MDKELRSFIGTRQSRTVDLRAQGAHIDVEAGTVELAFSSEEPYERWFGIEELDHSPGAVRLSDKLPLCREHDTGQQIGICERVRVDSDRRGRALARFSKRQDAQDELRDIADGIRGPVSVGYIVHEMKLKESREDGPDVYLVTDWEPLEISMVTVPADKTVGAGRSGERSEQMSEPENTAPEVVAETTPEPEVKEPEVAEPETAKPEAKNDEPAAVEVKAEPKEEKKMSDNLEPTPDVGLTPKETREYSAIKAIRSLANPNDRKLREDAAFEFDVSDAMSGIVGREASGFFLPNEVFQRDLSADVIADGGALVQETAAGQSMIELLRNNLVVAQTGATMLEGLVGDVSIPRQTGGATGYWVHDSDVTESQPTLGQVKLTPHTVGALTDIKRSLLKQSSIGAEQFVINDLALTAAHAIDNAVLNGAGTAGEPLGIVNTTGIGSKSFSSAGSPTYAELADLWAEVAKDNAARGSLSFVTNASMYAYLMASEVTSGAGRMMLEGDSLFGYPVHLSEYAPANTIVFGNWNDLVVAMWGTLDVNVDTATGSAAGTVRVVVHQDVDIALRNVVSMATGA